MAHPTANGFLGASFPAGGIPAAYTLIANKFFDLVDKNEVSLLKLWFIILWEKVIINYYFFILIIITTFIIILQKLAIIKKSFLNYRNFFLRIMVLSNKSRLCKPVFLKPCVCDTKMCRQKSPVCRNQIQKVLLNVITLGINLITINKW